MLKKLRKLLLDIIPGYAWIPLLSVVVWDLIVYFLSKAVIPEARYHYIAGDLDRSLPLVPAFVYIYVLAFVQWIVGYVVIARDSRERCYRVMSGELIAKTIALACFLIYPTAMDRPVLEVTNFSTWLLDFLYKADTPAINLLPSLHVLMSWFCFRGTIGLKRMPRWYTWLHFVFTLLVIPSVVLLKQHALIDIPAGIVVAEIGLFLSKRFRTGRVFERLEKKPKE